MRFSSSRCAIVTPLRVSTSTSTLTVPLLNSRQAPCVLFVCGPLTPLVLGLRVKSCIEAQESTPVCSGLPSRLRVDALSVNISTIDRWIVQHTHVRPRQACNVRKQYINYTGPQTVEQTHPLGAVLAHWLSLLSLKCLNRGSTARNEFSRYNRSAAMVPLCSDPLNACNFVASDPPSTECAYE
ncbi:hypothetical protein BDV97DRAFT_165765 [Delphinella strobiligena]|nr:hypothetical protein BDV97DRAFT_165765 [Delphinella strobiligena]